MRPFACHLIRSVTQNKKRRRVGTPHLWRRDHRRRRMDRHVAGALRCRATTRIMRARHACGSGARCRRDGGGNRSGAQQHCESTRFGAHSLLPHPFPVVPDNRRIRRRVFGTTFNLGSDRARVAYLISNSNRGSDSRDYSKATSADGSANLLGDILERFRRVHRRCPVRIDGQRHPALTAGVLGRTR